MSIASDPIYPSQHEERFDGITHAGMTLRQHYAGLAMQGLLANPGGPYQANRTSGWGLVNVTHETLARECRYMADALIAEPEKPQ